MVIVADGCGPPGRKTEAFRRAASGTVAWSHVRETPRTAGSRSPGPFRCRPFYPPSTTSAGTRRSGAVENQPRLPGAAGTAQTADPSTWASAFRSPATAGGRPETYPSRWPAPVRRQARRGGRERARAPSAPFAEVVAPCSPPWPARPAGESSPWVHVAVRPAQGRTSQPASGPARRQPCPVRCSRPPTRSRRPGLGRPRTTSEKPRRVRAVQQWPGDSGGESHLHDKTGPGDEQDRSARPLIRFGNGHRACPAGPAAPRRRAGARPSRTVPQVVRMATSWEGGPGLLWRPGGVRGKAGWAAKEEGGGVGFPNRITIIKAPVQPV